MPGAFSGVPAALLAARAGHGRGSGPPVPPGIHRIPAQRLARRELAKAIYRPSFWSRLNRDIFGWLNSLQIGPQRAGWWALITTIVVVVLVIAGVLYRIGPMRRNRRERAGAVLAGTQLTADDYRRAAERLAGGGDYAGAIIDRTRAIAVELEARGVLLPRPGRTASELAAEAASSLPDHAAGLREAARLFDDVRYGDRAGTPAGYQQVRQLDESIRSARTPAVAAAGPTGGADATGRAGGAGLMA